MPTVQLAPLGLVIRAIRAADIGPLVPIDPQPVQVFIPRRNQFGAAALRVEIFIPEDQFSLVLARTFKGRPESACVAEMKQAGGRWRDAASIFSGRLH